MPTPPLPSQPIPTPKIMLEGTHLTWKTDIAFALAEHPRIIGHREHRWHIPLISSEWETISEAPPTKGDPGHSAIDFAPHEEAWAMDAYHTWMRLLELHRDHYWIVDRFHISTRSYQLTHAHRDYAFDWLEKRLLALDFRLVHCVRAPETFPAAREARLQYSENSHRYDDLDIFIEEQEQIRRLVALSKIPSLEVDTSDNDVDRAANEILDWVESTGAFWPARRW